MGAGASIPTSPEPNTGLEEVFTEKLTDYLLNSKPALVPLVVFKMLDNDKKGLSYERFQQYLVGKLEPKPEEMPSFDAVVTRVYTAMDKDNNGRVTNREFTQWLKTFKQAEGSKKQNIAKAEAAKSSVRRAVSIGSINVTRARRSNIFSAVVSPGSPAGNQPIPANKAEFTVEQQRERRERRAVLKLSAADRAVQTLANARDELEQIHASSIIFSVAEELKAAANDLRDAVAAIEKEHDEARKAEDEASTREIEGWVAKLESVRAQYDEMLSSPLKGNHLEDLDDLSVVLRDAQRGYDKAKAAAETNRANRQGAAILNPEFLFDSIHKASDLAVSAKIASTALAAFKKKEVKGKFVTDLEPKTAKELQALEKILSDAENELAEAETAHKDNVRDYEDLQRHQAEATQMHLELLNEAGENTVEEAHGLKSCTDVREEIEKLYYPMSVDLIESGLIDRAHLLEGDVAFHPFTDTRLGQEVFTNRDSVKYEFWDQLNILEEFSDTNRGVAHRRAYSPAWGALLTSFMNEFDKTPTYYLEKAKSELRYIELGDSKVRRLGFASLDLGAKTVIAPRDKPRRLLSTLASEEVKEEYRSFKPFDTPELEQNWKQAEAQYFMSQVLPTRDKIGIDFYVSHDEMDAESAPQRWAAMTRLADRFFQLHGRHARFWIADFCLSPGRRASLAARLEVMATTVMSCKRFLALQTPGYFGCSIPSLRCDPNGWALMECFSTCCLAPSADPTRRMIWLPLFQGRTVPPKLNFLHGSVAMPEPATCEWILHKFALYPGGLVLAQRCLSSIWMTKFRTAYCYWALAADCAATGDAMKLAKMVRDGASLDLPLDWEPSDVNVVANLSADLIHEKWREQLVGEERARWRPVDVDGVDKDWFDMDLHSGIVRGGGIVVANESIAEESKEVDEAEGKDAEDSNSSQLEVNLDNPLILLPPSCRHENEHAARACLASFKEYPEDNDDHWAKVLKTATQGKTLTPAARAKMLPAVQEEFYGAQVHNAWKARHPTRADMPAFEEMSASDKEKNFEVVRIIRKMSSPAFNPSLSDQDRTREFLLSDDDAASQDDAPPYDDAAEIAAANDWDDSDNVPALKQPLQAAVCRYFEEIKSSKSKSKGSNTSASYGYRKQKSSESKSDEGVIGSVMKDFNRMNSIDTSASILGDPCTRLLVEAGADVQESVNQAVIGDEALSDAEVFPVLKALLSPLFAQPPCTINLMQNNLSRAAAERMVRFAESEPGLFSLVGLDDNKIAAQNRTATESWEVTTNSTEESLLFEGKVADWCTEGLPVLYRPAFPNGLASPGHVERLLPGTRFTYRSSRPMTVRFRPERGALAKTFETAFYELDDPILGGGWLHDFEYRSRKENIGQRAIKAWSKGLQVGDRAECRSSGISVWAPGSVASFKPDGQPVVAADGWAAKNGQVWDECFSKGTNAAKEWKLKHSDSTNTRSSINLPVYADGATLGGNGPTAKFQTPTQLNGGSRLAHVEGGVDLQSSFDIQGGGIGMRGLIGFEAQGRHDLRASSFLLLCRELASPLHVHCLQSLDLSSNPHFAGTLRYFSPLVHLRSLNCAFCPKLRGPLSELFAPYNNGGGGAQPQSLPKKTRLNEPGKGAADASGSDSDSEEIGPLQLTHLKLNGTSVGGDLATCGHLRALKALDLTRTKVGGDLKELSELDSLESLKLAGLLRVMGDLFPSLRRLRKLTEIDLQRTNVGISGSSPSSPSSLRSSSDFNNASFATASGLDGCEAWEKLAKINLSSCSSLRGSIASLAACPKLVDVNLSFTSLRGGRDLDLFVQLKQLKVFRAISCPGLFERSQRQSPSSLSDAERRARVMALQEAEALLAVADEKKQPLPTVQYTAGAHGDNDAKEGSKDESAPPIEAAAVGGGSEGLSGGTLEDNGRTSPNTAESKDSFVDMGEAFDKAKAMLDLQKRLPDLSFLWTD